MPFHLHLDRETISQIGLTLPCRVESGASIREVIQQMQSEKRPSVIVCQGPRMVGIFTERDVVRCLAAHQDLNRTIDTVMTRDPVTVHPLETVGNAIRLMSAGRYRRLPVLDQASRPVGLVKVSHVLHYLVQQFPKIVYNLPPKPHVKVHEREGA